MKIKYFEHSEDAIQYDVIYKSGLFKMIYYNKWLNKITKQINYGFECPKCKCEVEIDHHFLNNKTIDLINITKNNRLLCCDCQDYVGSKYDDWNLKTIKKHYKQYKRETSKLRAFIASISWYGLAIIAIVILFVIKLFQVI